MTYASDFMNKILTTAIDHNEYIYRYPLMLGKAPKTPFLYAFWKEDILESPLKSARE